MADENKTTVEIRKLFSEKFKAAFDEKNLTFRDVSHSTKIMPQFVKALLDGQFDQLPGQVFGLGFVKNICKALGIDADEYINLYKQGWDDYEASNLDKKELNQAAEMSAKKDPILKSDDDAKSTARFSKYYAIAAVLVIGFATGSYFMMGNDKPKAKLSATIVKDSDLVANLTKKVEEIKDLDVSDVVDDREKTAEIVEAHEKDEMEKVVAKAKIDASNSIKAQKVQIEQQEKQEEVKKEVSDSLLQIVVKERVKIKHKIDANKYDVKEFDPDIYQFDIKEVADLLIYDASAVEINYGGRALGKLGGKGRIRRLRFTKLDDSQEKL